jgi:hypothetical protein
MLGESNGVTTLLNYERIQRDNQAGAKSKVPVVDEEHRTGDFSDVTSFSPEALALARNVAPVSSTAEQSQPEQQSGEEERQQNSTAGFLDIRV